jgi:hypothetical protein
MEHHVRVNWLGAAVVLALGLGVSVVTSTIVAGRAYQQRAVDAGRAGQSVSVKGSARVRVKSDLAVWHIRVRGEGPKIEEAFAKLEEGAQRVQAFLTKAGFAPEGVKLSAIETNTFYKRDEKGNSTREVSGYALTRSFGVSTPEVERVLNAAGGVTQLIREGVLVESSAPEYYYSKLPDMRVSILGEASKDARARADEIAKNTGARVGEVRSAQMGPLQVVQPNSTDVSSGGMYDTATIDKDITAVVTINFGLDNR